MNREILKISLPSIITNITVPLLGMVDVAIVGHIGNASYIAAIALGTMVFNLIYWNFGFLRAGTSGMTAQAYGAEDKTEYLNVLVRGIAIALSSAVLIMLLQRPIAYLCKKWIDSSPETIGLMLTYFYIRIWAAPATISIFVFKGWFLGMQNASSPMWIATLMNVVNILCSLLFVYVLKADISGVAWGTVAAQYSGLLLAIAIWIRRYGHLWKDIVLQGPDAVPEAGRVRRRKVGEWGFRPISRRRRGLKTRATPNIACSARSRSPSWTPPRPTRAT